MRGRYDPIVLTAAITGGDVFRSQSPHIPCGAEAIVAEALRAAEAGAACIHVHAREELDGRPTGSPELFSGVLLPRRPHCGSFTDMGYLNSRLLGEE